MTIEKYFKLTMVTDLRLSTYTLQHPIFKNVVYKNLTALLKCFIKCVHIGMVAVPLIKF